MSEGTNSSKSDGQGREKVMAPSDGGDTPPTGGATLLSRVPLPIVIPSHGTPVGSAIPGSRVRHMHATLASLKLPANIHQLQTDGARERGAQNAQVSSPLGSKAKRSNQAYPGASPPPRSSNNTRCEREYPHVAKSATSRSPYLTTEPHNEVTSITWDHSFVRNSNRWKPRREDR